MNMEHKKIILGDEYDDNLRDALRVVLLNNGAVGLDKSWDVGGSQEIETVQVKLCHDLITIESETFVGLTIEGPKLVVENLARQVRDQG